MNDNPVPFDSQEEEIEAAAVSWLCEREEGFAAGREDVFFAWKQADARHAQAVARVEASMALLTEMPAVRTSLQGSRKETRFATRRTTPPSRRLSWGMAIAAALAVAALFGFYSHWVKRSYSRTVIATSEPQRLALPDGSVINVNGGSDLEIRFSRERRSIELIRGEAHFAVAHETQRPFVVTAGGVAVRAVGTAFNVRMAAEEVQVLVVEGKVELADAAAISPRTAQSVAPEARPMVVAGEHTAVPRQLPLQAPKVEKAEAGLVRETLAWHTRVMDFSDVPLREVIAQFNLRNETQLKIFETSLAERKIGGSFPLNQVEAFVRLLAQEGDVEIERRGEHEIVLRPARE